MIIPSLTEEWLEVYDKAVESGEDFTKSIWWRLALHSLPMGVDPNDPKVLAALENIRKKIE